VMHLPPQGTCWAAQRKRHWTHTPRGHNDSL
jgi:hypothetical protein